MDLSSEKAELKDALNIRISRETYVLGAICAVDMISTIMLVHSGKAIEANPVLMPFMDHGLACFFVAKTLLFLIPLFALELLRSKRPVFVKKMLRIGIAAYLISYGVGVMHLNQPQNQDAGQVGSRPTSAM